MPNATVMFFSPTGNTKAVCLYVEKLLGKKYKTALVDVTLPADRVKAIEIEHNGELLIIASPVYAQGAVKLFADFLNRLSLNFLKAAVICTYGGISCGSGIKDLTAILTKKGIPVIAAAEIPSAHHFALAGVKGLKGIELTDLNEHIELFVKKIYEKAAVIKTHRTFYIGKVLSQGFNARATAYAPQPNKKLCQGCNTCEAVCPVRAINNTVADKKECIRCAACIYACPFGARELILKSFIPVAYLKWGLGRRDNTFTSSRFYF